MIEAVKTYNSIGLSCLPCKLDKSPDTKGTWNKIFQVNEFSSAKAIGIKCGKESGGLECIDLDNHQGTAKQNLIEFIEQIKDLYDKYKFPIELTKNGGYHFLYKCSEVEGNKKLAEVPILKDGKWIPDAIFETRGEGGYFCAFPSPGYVVEKNDIFNIPTITPQERNIIISICKSFNKFLRPENNITSEFEKSEKPGNIYNNTFEAPDDMRRILENSGWKPKGNFQWIRPGKSEGISATLGKVASNCFYVFSANAYPFEPNKGYSPFQVMALLEYKGDFKACAKYLSEKLNLNPEPRHEQTPKKQNEKKELSNDDKKDLLLKYLIDTSIEIEKPPVVLWICDINGTQTIVKRMFSLGNFSAIIGKAKSRKTFNLTMISSALVKNDWIYFKFWGTLPINKKACLYFDTEQSDYDSANTMKRIERLAECNTNHFSGFNLRDLSPKERCEFIENALSFFPQVGYVVIDGVADLATANNDELEATRVTGLLLRWTKQYNCHISVVIHQNKNDNFATGHLGSSIMKKAEIVISTTKEKGSQFNTIVSCDYSRGIDFEDYEFSVNENGLPEMVENIPSDFNTTKFMD